ncbi:MAG: CRISPR system precrRNA processing endoribonuclease RAMP protein Cas6 [Chitinophagales bacterium]|nr:CRISPR system precrRNA processing endoribonuclease RAMP protein Cas6 [Chitinophagales bacterium]
MHLSLYRYKIDFSVKQPYTFSGFLGSKIRGAFGDFMLKTDEPLFDLFYKPQLPKNHIAYAIVGDYVPKPFVIYPYPMPKNLEMGDIISFEIVLFGDYHKYFDRLLHVFEQMAEQGMGNNTFKADFVGMCRIPSNWSEEVEHRLTDYKTIKIPDESYFRLYLKSPTKLLENKLLSADFSFFNIYKKLHWRIQLLASIYGRNEEPIIELKKEDFKKWPQLSQINVKVKNTNRNPNNKEAYSADGYVGGIIYTKPLQEFIAYLAFGQYLHLGSDTSFGFGRYELTVYENQ